MGVSTDARTAGVERVFLADPAEFSSNFDRHPFGLRHTLAEHPLFSVGKLAQVAQQLMESGRGYRFVNREAQPNLNARFDAIPARKQVVSAFHDLERSNAWMKLKNVGDVEPAYTDILNRAIDDISELSGVPIREQLTVAQITIFLSSPHSVTPYHFDHESNFLCQIQGDKTVCVFEPDVGGLVPYPAVERFYCGDLNSVDYRTEQESTGKLFDLRPGCAVHHPPLAPHWVKNGDAVSVSASFNLCLKDIDRRAHVFQMNYYLRKLGIRPVAPGASAFRDTLKAGFFEALGRSNPRSPDEAVSSGLDRLRQPVYALRRIYGSVLRPR